MQPRSKQSELLSLGRLAEWLRVPYSRLVTAIAEAGIAPTLTLNDVDYYSIEAAEQLRDAMSSGKNARCDA